MTFSLREIEPILEGLYSLEKINRNISSCLSVKKTEENHETVSIYIN